MKMDGNKVGCYLLLRNFPSKGLHKNTSSTNFLYRIHVFLTTNVSLHLSRTSLGRASCHSQNVLVFATKNHGEVCNIAQMLHRSGQISVSRSK